MIRTGAGYHLRRRSSGAPAVRRLRTGSGAIPATVLSSARSQAPEASLASHAPRRRTLALLRTWIGDHPSDHPLRSRLLGLTPSG